MSSKKALRRQRAERAKERRTQQRNESKTFKVALVLTAILIVGTLVIAAVNGGGGETGDRVWSEEHGHWHDR